MRKKLFALLLAVVGMLSNLNALNTSEAQEQINFKDDYRVYEPFNLSDTKKVNIKGKVNLDFTNSTPQEKKLVGLYKGEYFVKNNNDGNSTLKMGVTFASNLENLSKFSIKVNDADVNYSFKFLNDKFKQPNGTEFYKEIVNNSNSDTYTPVNFKKEDVGVLRKFSVESSNSETLKYEITVKYSVENSKVFFSGGTDVSVEENKSDRVLKADYISDGKSKTPMLFVIGENVNITTKIFSGDKELTSGYKENIEKTSISVMDFFKELFLNGIPENARQKFSDDNLFEIFAEGFDKIIAGSGYDNIAVLNSTNDKQVVAQFEFPIEHNTEKKVNIVYPITAGLTTVNDNNVMRLNIETSALSTFDKFDSLNYVFNGIEDYKYIVSSNVKYKNTANNSTVSINKLPSEVISSLVYKENYLKGISELPPKSYTNLILILLAFVEIAGVIYVRNVYFTTKKARKRH